MATAKTKEALLHDALILITANPQIPTAGFDGQVFLSSADVYYEYVVATEMEDFIYGFGLKSYKLENPEEETTLSGTVYEQYSIPQDVANAVCVCDESDVPEINSLIGALGKNDIPTYNYRIEKENKISVSRGDYEQDKQDLVLIYVTNQPSTADMSAAFKNGVRFAIAAEYATRLAPESNIRIQWERKSNFYFTRARNLSLDNTGRFTYSVGSLADQVLVAGVDGRAHPFVQSPSRGFNRDAD